MTSLGLDVYRSRVVSACESLAPLSMSARDAVGCVVAADVEAVATPAVAVASADGYAVLAADTAGAPVVLPVTHDVGPLTGPTRVLPGTAARVTRGAPLPAGADAVFAVQPEDPAQAVITRALQPGDGVTAAGSQLNPETPVVTKGSVLTVGHVAALAASAVGTLLVHPAPRVVLLSVGTEVRGHERGAEGTVGDATGTLVAALLRAAGARVVASQVIDDDAAHVRTAIEEAGQRADLVVTTGGLSGDWTDVLAAVAARFFEAEVVEVRLEPGGVHGVGVAARHGERAVPLIMIPGDPMSAAAAVVGYVLDAVASLKFAPVGREIAKAAAGWSSPRGHAQAVPVRRIGKQGGVAVEPAIQGDLSSLAALAVADGIALVAEGVAAVQPGDVVDVAWWRQ